MPRVRPFTRDKLVEEKRATLADQVDRRLLSERISKTDIADYLNISPQAVSQQFKKNKLTMEVFIAAVNLADMNAEDIEKLVKL